LRPRNRPFIRETSLAFWGWGVDPLLNDRLEPSPESVGRREAGKAKRRALIIQAARQLIRETGNAGLSMRALAARAGVSLATPYNLFGSKRAIILAVHQDVREFHQRFSITRSADPVERIFAAVDMSVDYYIGDPPFYRTLWAAVFDTTDEIRTEIYNPKRDAFWQGLINAAADAGAVADDMDLDHLLHQLDYLFRSVMLDWVVGELAPECLAPTIRLGYALILKGAASPDWRGPLQARILESQAFLKSAAAERVSAGGGD
jgi:AcrR family transcriptional regulator